jgi:hypothetical protein
MRATCIRVSPQSLAVLSEQIAHLVPPQLVGVMMMVMVMTVVVV